MTRRSVAVALVAGAVAMAQMRASGAIYTGGPGDAHSMSAMGGNVHLGGAEVAFVSAASQSFLRGYAPVGISTITITDDATPGIKSGTPIVIRIPSGLVMTWDETDTTATFGGTASGKVGAISYASGNKHLVVSVTSDFAASDTLTISGLSFKNYLSSGAGRLQLDFDSNGLIDADDGKTVAIFSTFHRGGNEDNYAASAMDDDQKLRANEGAVFLFVRNAR